MAWSCTLLWFGNVTAVDIGLFREQICQVFKVKHVNITWSQRNQLCLLEEKKSNM